MNEIKFDSPLLANSGENAVLEKLRIAHKTTVKLKFSAKFSFLDYGRKSVVKLTNNLNAAEAEAKAVAEIFRPGGDFARGVKRYVALKDSVDRAAVDAQGVALRRADSDAAEALATRVASLKEKIIDIEAAKAQFC